MACVSKRKGKWIVDYRVGANRFCPSFGTKSEAELFLRELRLRPLDNLLGFKQIKSVSVKDAVSNYIENVTPRKALRTKEVDTLALKELADGFPSAFVDEVTLENLELYQLRLLKRVKASSVNRKFNVIRHFFKKCTEWRYCRENPALVLAKLKEDHVERKPLTTEQMSELILALPKWASRVFYFIAKTGVRRGEACDLTWQMVDLDKRNLRIKSVKGGVTRYRSIPMTEELFNFVLTIWNEREQTKADIDFVFLSHLGRAINKSRFSEKVTTVGKRLGIENAGVHIVRHTLLTDLSNENQSGSSIQKLAGHSSLVTTQKYLHPNNDDLRRTLEAHESKNSLLIPLNPVKRGS